MIMKSITTLGLGFSFFLAGSAAQAAGVTLDADASWHFYINTVNQQPGVTWTFTTSNLSAGSDTVIHIQNADDPQAGFIAGNDDFGGTLASQVVVPPAATARNLRIVIRSYSEPAHGSCQFAATPSSGSGGFTTIASFGGMKYFPGNLPASAHVTTAERQGGTDDTVLLVVGGTADHAVAFDDDDGVGLMSWVHLPEACTNCQVIVANFDDIAASRKTDLIWDDDPDTANPDGDGLGNSLEAFLGTNPNNVDSDQDGINDDHELLGKEASPPLKYSTWGASPTQKDMFVEIDWQACTGDASVCPSGIDSGQVPPHEIAQLKADLAPLRVHVDNGLPNTDPATWYDYGAWGGAQRQNTTFTPGQVCGNEFESPERVGTFHTGFSFTEYNGHVCWLPTPYFVTTPLGRVIAHEIGHGLALHHGGRPFTLSVNYKTNYFSLMNYRSQWGAPAFSNGTLPTLNPRSLNEQFGIGTTDSATIAGFSTYYNVNTTTGAIDWNRDGTFQSSGTAVQGPISLDDFSHYAQTRFTGDNLKDASGSWVNVGGNLGQRFWIFGRGPSNQLQFGIAAGSTISSSCGNITSVSEGGDENCAGFNTTTFGNAPGSNRILNFGPGVAELNSTLLVVSQPTTGTIISNVVSMNGSTGQVTFGSNVTLPGGFTATGDITALSTATGVVTVWAPVGNRLKQWRFQNGSWSSATNMQWSDGSFIVPQFGIGATKGFQDNSSTVRIYAAIPTAPSGVVEFARQDATNNRWTKISSWQQTGVQPTVKARPGLAYQKRAGGSNSVGRFYMALNQNTSCSGPFGTSPNCSVAMLITEGNMASGTTRRLRWIPPAYFLAGGAVGGIHLIDDLTRDSNLRAIMTDTNIQTMYMPMADGIINGLVTDNDDYDYLNGALRASLWLEPLPLP
jgi:hypothetical protein